MIFCSRSYMCPLATVKMWMVSGSSSGLRPVPLTGADGALGPRPSRDFQLGGGPAGLVFSSQGFSCNLSETPSWGAALQVQGQV